MKKIAVLFICLFMVSAIFAFDVFAFEAENGKIENPVGEISVFVNPFYQDVITEEEIAAETYSAHKAKAADILSEHSRTYNSVEEAADAARKDMAKRESNISVTCAYPKGTPSDEIMDGLTFLYYCFEHTGVPDQGDYIQHQYGGCSYSYHTNTSDRIYVTYSYTMKYYTTAEQEEAVEKKIEEVFEKLGIEGKSDYQKLCSIYEYICNNVDYDYENLNDKEYKLKYTAYAALMNGTSVCSGYASLFYRMALEAGIDTRYISGIGHTGRHAWNISEIDGVYYNLDSTWDEEGRTDYFLRCNNNFPNHTRDGEYDTAAFNEKYPMSKSDYVHDFRNEDSDILLFGIAGAEEDGMNVRWSIGKDGVLAFSGKGKMVEDIPHAIWKNHKDLIKTLVIEEGITSIGTRTFYDCPEIEGEIVIPDSVKTIGDYAFFGCKKITGCIFGTGVESIGKYAFYNYEASDFFFKGDAPEIYSQEGEDFSYPTFDDYYDTVFYPENNDTWDIVDGTWHGIKAESWNPNSGDYVDSGYCGGEGDGKNLSWELNRKGVLTISGKGKMKDFASGMEDDVPWGKYSGRIRNVVLSDGITSIGNYAFKGFSGLGGELALPDSITKIGKYAFQDTGITGNLVLPKKLTEIGDSAFSCCWNLSGNIVLPEGLITIGEYAFESCYWVTGELVLPESLTSIGDYAFFNCPGFTGDLIIPDSVTHLGDAAFYWCSGFSGKLVIGEGVTDIGYYTFRDCENLTGKVVFSKNITSINMYAFVSCGIDKYYFEGNAPKVDSAEEDYCSFDAENDTIYYPKGNNTWKITNGKWNGYTACEWSFEQTVTYGDVTGDGKINILDANLIRKSSARLIELSEEQISAADVNGDGKVNILDANLIRKFAAKVIEVFPIEE